LIFDWGTEGNEEDHPESRGAGRIHRKGTTREEEKKNEEQEDFGARMNYEV
jgi:hypothetical protein